MQHAQTSSLFRAEGQTEVKTWTTRIQKSPKKAHTNVTGAESTQNKNKTCGLYLHEHNRKMYLSIKKREDQTFKKYDQPTYNATHIYQDITASNGKHKGSGQVN